MYNDIKISLLLKDVYWGDMDSSSSKFFELFENFIYLYVVGR